MRLIENDATGKRGQETGSMGSASFSPSPAQQTIAHSSGLWYNYYDAIHAVHSP